MAAGEIYQITDVQVMHAQPLANVWYMEVIDDTGAGDDMQEVATAFEDNVVVIMAASQSSELEHDCLLVRRVVPTTTPARVFPVGINGSTSANALPSNQALTIRHYSAIGNKNQRGRAFISGILESTVDEGRLKASVVTGWQVLLNTITAQIDSNGHQYRLKHYSKKLNQFWDIEEADLNPRLTKVRNRTPGVCLIS